MRMAAGGFGRSDRDMDSGRDRDRDRRPGYGFGDAGYEEDRLGCGRRRRRFRGPAGRPRVCGHLRPRPRQAWRVSFRQSLFFPMHNSALACPPQQAHGNVPAAREQGPAVRDDWHDACALGRYDEVRGGRPAGRPRWAARGAMAMAASGPLALPACMQLAPCDKPAQVCAIAFSGDVLPSDCMVMRGLILTVSEAELSMCASLCSGRHEEETKWWPMGAHRAGPSAHAAPPPHARAHSPPQRPQQQQLLQPDDGPRERPKLALAPRSAGAPGEEPAAAGEAQPDTASLCPRRLSRRR